MKILKPKYYLNKKLKPRKNGDVDTYPVYFRFTIGKNNHRLKSFLIGNLENDNQLADFEEEISLEVKALNYLYIRFNDYSFDNFSSDAHYLCSPLSTLLEHYILENSDGPWAGCPIHAYTAELIFFTSFRTQLSEEFISNAINIQLKSLLPSEFIKDQELKIIIETYNYSILFDKKLSSSFCIYNWENSNLKDDFIKLYGLSHGLFLDSVVKLYSAKIQNK